MALTKWSYNHTTPQKMKSKTKPQISLSVVSSLYLTQNSHSSVYSIIRAFILYFNVIFVNNLPNVLLSSFILLFADDTKCAKTITDVFDCHFLQADLNRLYQWSQNWNLHFNEEK